MPTMHVAMKTSEHRICPHSRDLLGFLGLGGKGRSEEVCASMSVVEEGESRKGFAWAVLMGGGIMWCFSERLGVRGV